MSKSPNHRRSSRPRRSFDHAESPSFSIYGRHPVLEMLQSRPSQINTLLMVEQTHPRSLEQRYAEILNLASQSRIAVRYVSREAFDRLYSDVSHQGVAAELCPFEYADFESLMETLDSDPLILVLDHIQDPHNLGALARSALAFGASALIIPKDRSAQVTPAAFKASAGALAHVPVVRVVNLARALTQMASFGLQVIGTQIEAETTPAEVNWQLGSVLVVGNEQHGLRPLTAARCQGHVRIPIETIGSLNASVAGAVCLYEARRQRTRTRR